MRRITCQDVLVMIMFSTEDGSGEIFQHNNGGTVPARDTGELGTRHRVTRDNGPERHPEPPALTSRSILCRRARGEITCVARA